MSRKAFLVEVELDIQAITCPGVWLCSNGQVSLQLYMLDSCIQTTNRKPIFPILCHEKFVFYKTYYTKHRLIDLQRQMSKEWLYVELIQWQSCELGNVLATFQTTLDELLFPSSYRGSESGADIDLLMEPTPVFPGTIAPKIEVSTKTTIEETICNCNRPSSSTVVVNPKTIVSCPKMFPKHARRVCHSIAYSRGRRSRSVDRRRPPFRYRKAEDDLIYRKITCDPEDAVPCKCQDFCGKVRTKPSCTRWAEQMIRKRMKMKARESARTMQCPCAVKLCNCGSGHAENSCPVCAEYKGYFKPCMNIFPQPQRNCQQQMRSALCTKPPCIPNTVYIPQCNCRSAQEDRPTSQQNACNCVSDDANGDKKVCFCDQPNKQSLAEKIHERLSKTLSCVPNCLEYDLNYDLCGCANTGTTPQCVCQHIGLAKTCQELEEKNECDGNNNKAEGCPLCNLCNCIS